MTATGGLSQPEALSLVYDELRLLAERYLRDEPIGQTLQPTALVHEVYLRLGGREADTWESRAQFFAVAATAMRRLLIDRARKRRALKRGGGRRRVALDDLGEIPADRDEYLVALDDALTELAAVDGQLCRVVELRFFAGLTVPECARVVGVAPATVKRMWALARGWLHRQIALGPVAPPSPEGP